MTIKRIALIVCLVLVTLAAVACEATPTPSPVPAQVAPTPTPVPAQIAPTPTPIPILKLEPDTAGVSMRAPQGGLFEEIGVGQKEPVDTDYEIATLSDGLGTLYFLDCLKVKVFPDTRLQVQEVPGPDGPRTVKLHLFSGKVLLQELPCQVEQQVNVTIETDSAMIRVASEVCMVSVDGEGVTWVEVLDGEAEVDAKKQTVIVGTGQATWVESQQAPHAPITVPLGASVKAVITPSPTPTTTPTPTQTPTVTPTPTPTMTPTSKEADVRLISDLEISNLTPFADEIITATFKVGNFGEQTFSPKKFGVKGRDPDDLIEDFSMDALPVLAFGDVYTYTMSRSFSKLGEYWFTPHYSPDGVNIWSDITWPDDERSVVTVTVESLPVVEEIHIEPSTINQGDTFAIRVIASDHLGVQSIRWRSEGTGSEYLDDWRESSCGGVGDTQCEQSWSYLKWTGRDGEFPIYVEAFDTASLSSGQVSRTITVKPKFTLFIGGGAFTKESVQNALGFGVNWKALPKEIGEVVLVDFLSGETLPGPTEMAYRPESAKELLAGAGYPNGFDAVLLFVPEDELAGKLADSVASYLSMVRIRPEKLLVDRDNARSEFSARIAAGKSGLLIERQE